LRYLSFQIRAFPKDMRLCDAGLARMVFGNIPCFERRDFGELEKTCLMMRGAHGNESVDSYESVPAAHRAEDALTGRAMQMAVVDMAKGAAKFERFLCFKQAAAETRRWNALSRDKSGVLLMDRALRELSPLKSDRIVSSAAFERIVESYESDQIRKRLFVGAIARNMKVFASKHRGALSAIRYRSTMVIDQRLFQDVGFLSVAGQAAFWEVVYGVLGSIRIAPRLVWQELVMTALRTICALSSDQAEFMERLKLALQIVNMDRLLEVFLLFDAFATKSSIFHLFIPEDDLVL